MQPTGARPSDGLEPFMPDARALAAGARGTSAPYVVAVAVSAALHVAAFTLATVAVEPKPFGAGGIDAESLTVEVSLATPAALSSSQPLAEPATASAASAATADGEQAAPARHAEMPVVEKSETEPLRPAHPAEPEPAPAIEPTPVMPAPAIERPIEQPEKEKRVNDEPEPPPSHAASEGGVKSDGADAVHKPARAAAPASPGEIQRFGRSVAELLGSNRPRITGPKRGTVKLTFQLDEEGLLTDARIKQSSGHETLDTTALETVRRLKFPKPPAGTTAEMRFFEVPYYFR